MLTEKQIAKVSSQLQAYLNFHRRKKLELELLQLDWSDDPADLPDVCAEGMLQSRFMAQGAINILFSMKLIDFQQWDQLNDWIKKEFV